MMTSVDLCAMYKPWDVQKNIVNTIMDEFWQEVCLCFSDKWTITRARERERDFVFSSIFYFNLKSIRNRVMMKNDEEFNLNHQWIDHWHMNCQPIRYRSNLHISYNQFRLILGKFYQEYLSPVLFINRTCSTRNNADVKWS
jgi:hypothetical protein